MPNRTFTDDSTGEKYKVTFTADDGSMLQIKPLPKPESEKETYYLQFDRTNNYDLCLISEYYKFTPEQGERVASGVSALMEYIQTPYQEGEQETIKREMDANKTKHRWIETAREALQRGAEGTDR